MGESIRFGDLRGMLQYVPQFRGRTFVVSVDGGVVASSSFSNILLDIAALRSLNINVVLAHGASWQIRELAKQRGVSISNDDGTGSTNADTLELSIDAITRLTSTMMQHLTSRGVRTATANAIIAHRAGVIGGVDMMHTGRIDRVDVGSLSSMLGDGIMPVIPPIAYDGQGNTLRINSDEAAAEVAMRLEADKILYLLEDGKCDGTGLPEKRQLSVLETREHLRHTGLGPSVRSKLANAVAACDGGVRRVHLIYGDKGDAPLLAELFSNEGVGIMVFADSYYKIRQASRSDVEDMISMMRPAVEKEKLLYRSREEILERLSDYYVVEVDGNVLGSVAVHAGQTTDLVELACLFIKRSHENQGYGKKLVAFAEEKARAIGAGRLFALSTQASDFFTENCGFKEVEADILPPERRERCKAGGRNSRLLVKDL